MQLITILTVISTLANAGLIGCTKSPCENGKIRNEIDCQCYQGLEYRLLESKTSPVDVPLPLPQKVCDECPPGTIVVGSECACKVLNPVLTTQPPNAKGSIKN